MKPALLVSAVLSALLLTQCAVPAGGGGGSLPPSTKEQPFVNSLGMKFVPVPGTNILMCTTETTVAQYQAAGMGYEAPQFPQGSSHPAVNVSWSDAKAWCAWLSKREGRRYRLPTEAEWSSAVGSSTYPWGNEWPPPNNSGNYAGQEMKVSLEAMRFMKSVGMSQAGVIGDFGDRHVFTAPVGSYPANRMGIHDLGGNAWEWKGDESQVRGASWNSYWRHTLESSCNWAVDGRGFAPSGNGFSIGFRCVVER